VLLSRLNIHPFLIWGCSEEVKRVVIVVVQWANLARGVFFGVRLDCHTGFWLRVGGLLLFHHLLGDQTVLVEVLELRDAGIVVRHKVGLHG
jgi:hypothetical protein